MPTLRHRAGGALVLLVTALLGACGPSDTAPGPGGVTVGEARALDEAAEMLDEQRLPAEALPSATPSPSPSPSPPVEPEQSEG